ncbi:MAG: pilus assembly protein [Firmicutes bacterium]|nr:pilus assembly protein [Bacillota bacterium]
MWLKKIRDQRGQALVEFALVVPLLLILMFGIIEFGMIYFDQLVISNAVRGTARLVAVQNVGNTAAITSKVLSLTTFSTTEKNKVVITSIVYTQSDGTTIAADRAHAPLGTIKIAAKYPVHIIIPFLSPMIGVQYDVPPADGHWDYYAVWVQSQCTMRIE